MMVILVFVALVVPVRLAFSEDDTEAWVAINYFVDGSFALDLILTFFTSYFDDKLLVDITSKKQIAINYMKTWFFVDALSIFPFEPILSQINWDHIGALVQITRVTKLYKLIRMVRLLKMARLFKDRRKITENLDKVLRISAGLERLAFFSIVYLVFVHIITCLWIFVAGFSDENNWVLTEFGPDWRDEG